jgi:ankyrin repeat protein
MKSHSQSKLYIILKTNIKTLKCLFLNRDKRGMTPLGHAIKSHKWDAAKFLLAVGADPDLPDLRGRTPRDWAALNGKKNTLAGLTA